MPGNLSVGVKDGTTALPLAGVRVRILGPCNCQEEATTDASGYAEFSNIVAGTYSITASLRDYRDATTVADVRPSTSNLVTLSIHVSRHVYFAIFYKEEDDAFKRTAETWKTEILRRVSYRPTLDTILLREVQTEADFRQAWKDVATEGKLPGRIVIEGRLLTHASKGSNQDGLEFMQDSTDGTVTRAEIPTYEKLNWLRGGVLVLHGCNTGINGERGWTPAAEFAKAQGVEVLGQVGYGYFSSDPNVYIETNRGTPNMYLWHIAEAEMEPSAAEKKLKRRGSDALTALFG